MVNIMGADAMATKGARASTTMIFTVLNWNNSIMFFFHPRRGLMVLYYFATHHDLWHEYVFCIIGPLK